MSFCRRTSPLNKLATLKYLLELSKCHLHCRRFDPEVRTLWSQVYMLVGRELVDRLAVIRRSKETVHER